MINRLVIPATCAGLLLSPFMGASADASPHDSMQILAIRSAQDALNAIRHVQGFQGRTSSGCDTPTQVSAPTLRTGDESECALYTAGSNGVKSLDFVSGDFEVEFGKFRENLESACTSHARFAKLISCLSLEHGYIEDEARELPQWLLRRVSDGSGRGRARYDSNTLLCHLKGRSLSSQRNIFKQIWDFKKFDPELDVALLLTLAYRESGRVAFQNRRDHKNTFHSGGIDAMGSHLNILKKRYVPVDDQNRPLYGRQWNPAFREFNEGNYKVRPALVPRREFLAAYASWLHFNRDRLAGKMESYGFPKDSLERVDPKSRRTWMLLAFSGPYGAEFDQYLQRGKGLGVNTMLSYARDREAPLEFIQEHTVLKNQYRMQIARAYSVNTAALGQALGLD